MIDFYLINAFFCCCCCWRIWHARGPQFSCCMHISVIYFATLLFNISLDINYIVFQLWLSWYLHVCARLECDNGLRVFSWRQFFMLRLIPVFVQCMFSSIQQSFSYWNLSPKHARSSEIWMKHRNLIETDQQFIFDQKESNVAIIFVTLDLIYYAWDTGN